MIKLNDHYFLSWINVVKQKSIKIEKGNIFADITSAEYSTFLKEYNIPLNDTDSYNNISAKELCGNIRRVVKKLNSIKKNVVIEPLKASRAKNKTIKEIK